MKIAGKEYKVPEINFYQLDKLLELFPEALGFLQSDVFDPSNTTHLLFAVTKMLKGAPMRKLAALLIIPENEEYWKPEHFEKNLEITGAINPKALFTVKDGKIEPGELIDDFLASNGTLGELIDVLKGSMVMPKAPMDTPDSADIQPESEESTG